MLCQKRYKDTDIFGEETRSIVASADKSQHQALHTITFGISLIREMAYAGD